MPNNYWDIPIIWESECYILGGGTSLSQIPLDKLMGKRVIGCNDSYLLGANICDYVVFGDKGWYNIHKKNISSYKSLLVSNAENLTDIVSNVRVCHRLQDKISKKNNTLCWFYNSGTLAIDLAFKLGARKIYLLAFDMSLNKDGKANWYDNLKDKPNANVYAKFQRGFDKFALSMREVYPDAEVINANLDSKLEVFEKIDWREVIK